MKPKLQLARRFLLVLLGVAILLPSLTLSAPTASAQAANCAGADTFYQIIAGDQAGWNPQYETYESFLRKSLKGSGANFPPACADQYVDKIKASGELAKMEEKARGGAEEANRKGDEVIYGAQRKALENLNSIDDVKKAFNITGDTLDFQLKANYIPRGNTDRRFFKFGPENRAQGSPYVVWTKKDNQTSEDFKGGEVRFVLSTVAWFNKEDQGERGVDDITNPFNERGGAYVFRNEYNPSIAVVLFSKTGGIFVSGDEDFMMFLSSQGCEDAIMKDKRIVKAMFQNNPNLYGKGRGTEFPSDINDKDAQEIFKAYNIDKKNEMEFCEVSSSPFATALRNAQKKLKAFVDSFFTKFRQWTLDVVNIGDMTKNPGLVNAWKTMRDFVNLIFVLILAVIALSNILRIDTDRYGIRALLPRLIFGVIAVNFSFLFMQVLVNAAYILSQPFMKQAVEIIKNPPASGSLIDPTGDFGQFILTIFLVFAAVLALVILLFFFMIRILMIWLLTALSPFVFLFMILPSTRSLARSWWENAVKWVFMAPISFIILYIAASLLTGTKESNDINGPDFILKLGFFVGASIAAVMIPYRLGGEVMGRASNIGKKGGKMFGGQIAKRAGLQAAYEQRKHAAEERRAARGANINMGIENAKGILSAPASPIKAARAAKEGWKDEESGRIAGALGGAASAGRLGKKGRVRAQLVQDSLEQEEARKYASTFNQSELENMQNALPEGSKLRRTIELALELRTGKHELRQQAERAANELPHTLELPPALVDQSFGALDERSAKQRFNPALMAGVVNASQGRRWDEDSQQFVNDVPSEHQETAQRILQSLSPAAVRGLVETGNPAYVHALHHALNNGQLSTATSSNPDVLSVLDSGHVRAQAAATTDPKERVRLNARAQQIDDSINAADLHVGHSAPLPAGQEHREQYRVT